MDNKSLFEDNIGMISQKDSELAKKIASSDVSSLVFCKTDKGEDNLCDKLPQPNVYLHSQQGAVEEAKRWWEGLDLSNVDVLYLYGSGLGYFYPLIKIWLSEKNERYLVILEDDLRVLARLFETPYGKEILQDPQVRWHFLDFKALRPEGLISFMHKLSWYFCGLKSKTCALPYYSQNRKIQYEMLINGFSLIEAETTFSIGEFQDLGRMVFKNFYSNFLSIDHSYLEEKMSGKFAGIPAIICGAGASITKHLPLLKELKSHALFFAGGSTISLLNQQGINPHFAGIIDPHPPYRRFFLQTAFEGPFFFQTRVSAEILSLVHGPRIFASDAGAHGIEIWMRQHLLKFSKDLIGSYTVSDFLTQMAASLGCSPIIFLGLDLSFTEDRYYAAGLDTAKTTVLPEDMVEIVDIFGKKAFTKMDWKLSADMISFLASKYPQQTFINCTGGGIGFKGVPNASFDEIAKTHLKSSYDLHGLVQTALQSAGPASLPSKKVMELLSELKASLESCLNICFHMTQELNTIYPELMQKTDDMLKPFLGSVNKWEKKLHQEIAYENVLKKNWENYSKISERRREADEKLKGEKGAWIRQKVQEIAFYLYASKQHIDIIQKVLAEKSS